MQVRPNDLAKALERGLAPAYLVAGDETLVVEESCDAIIAAARAQGYTEREIVDGDTGFEWRRLDELAGSLSLFAERRIIDLRLSSKSFGRDAADAIDGYLARNAGDTLLLVRTGRLDQDQRKSKWFSRFDAGGVVMLAWPLGGDEFRRWLAARARRAGLALDADALAFLGESVEGNLLAAAQEIEKLRLLDLPQPIGLEALRAAVADASRFDGFDLVDAALSGDAARVCRVLYVLEEEGVDALGILGQLTWSIRSLARDGNLGMPQQRARLIEAARRRLRPADIEAALTLAATVDRQVKGAPGDPWRTLETLALRLAGVRLPVD